MSTKTAESNIMIALSVLDGCEADGVTGEWTRPARVSKKFDTRANGDAVDGAGPQVVSSRNSGIGGIAGRSSFDELGAAASSSHLIEAIVGPEMWTETAESS